MSLNKDTEIRSTISSKRFRTQYQLYVLSLLENKKRATSANASAHDEDFDSEHSDDDIGYSCGDNDLVDLEGLEPARKLNKGTILAKSIEYIKFLELKNDRMTHEHQQLLIKARMLGLVVDQSSLEQDNLPNI